MLTARIAGGVLALDFSASPVDRINVYQGQKLQTLELFMPERSLAPLKKNRYNLSINYQEGE